VKLTASMRSLVSFLFRRSHLETEMDEELRSHIENRADDLERSGLLRAEAERRARIEFGGQERFKEECREALGTHFLAACLQDVRYAFRALRRGPGFAIVAILTLTIGVGVNTSIFSLIYSLAIRPLPIKDASSLASVYQESRATSQHPRGIQGAPSFVSYPEYANYRDGNHVFSGLAAYAEIALSLSSANPESLHGLLASCNYFDVLGTNLAAGRRFIQSDCRTSGAGAVVVLSYGFWQSKFGGDRNVVGKTVMLNSQVFTVIGVTAPEFSGTELQVPDLWLPISMAPQLMPNTFGTRDWLALPNVSWLQVVGHLKPGISRRQAQAELTVLAHQMDANSPGARTNVTVNAAAFLNSPEIRTVGVWFAAGLFALAGLVLLMACANIANLLLARASTRQQEIGVRLALGANRKRLIRQLLTESILFTIPGGLAGLFIALWLPAVLIRVLPDMPETLPVNLTPNFTVLCYALLASLVAAVVSSLAPALHTTQPDLLTILKDDGASAGHSRSRTRLRGLLVAAQVAGCTLLLVVAGLLARGLHRVQDLNPGFATKNVFVMSFDLQQKGYDGPRAALFVRQMRDRLVSLPGVVGVTSSAVLPCVTGDLSGVTVPGSKIPGSILVLANIVSPDYFSTMGIPILQGHAFTEDEIDTNGPAPAVISRAMARKFWPAEDPIGKQFSASRDQIYRIVGIAPDLQNLHLGEVDGPFYYGAMNPRNNGALEAKIFVRISGSSEQLAAVPEVVRQLDPNVMITTESYEQILGKQLKPARTGAFLVGVLGLLAMLLAIVGVVGVVSYAAGRRVREIGIRRALGAQTQDVIRLLVGQSARVVAIGLACGLVLAAGSAVLLSAADLLFGVSPLDPLAFLGTTMLLAATAFFSMLIPAWRPARVDPMTALRRD